MSQENKLEFPEKVREFRVRAKLSQCELGERLGVSGNYISMLELGKKTPGPSLRKLFESMDQSPLYQSGDGGAGLLAKVLPPNPLLAMLSTETLIQNFVEVAEKLAQEGVHERKKVVGNLRELLDEIEGRMLASSAALSEAQQLAVKASKPGGNPGTK